MTITQRRLSLDAPDLTTRPVSMQSWMILMVLCVAQFVNVLNFQSVTLVLPALQHGLGFSSEQLQWVVSANVLSFGGGLLVGGRLADLFGHRRLFIIGLILGGLSTLACGFSFTQLMLILARILQGISSAMLIPAASALLIDTFPRGAYRYRALGIWSAVGPIGGMVGTLLGTALTDAFGWPWVFFMNVPLMFVALPFAFKLLPCVHEATEHVRLDVGGALLSTGGVVFLIAGLAQIVHPTGSVITVFALLAGFFASLLLFCMLEMRIPHPLLPLSFFRRPAIVGSSLVTLAFSAVANTPIFFFTLYMQQVRGFSSFMTGLAFLPTNLALIGGSYISARLIRWLGYKLVTLSGLFMLTLGVLLFTRLSVAGSYFWMLLPGLILLGGGLGITQVVVTGVGIDHVTSTEHGLVSSVLNMASQIGTAIGLATLVMLANLHTSLYAGGYAQLSATEIVSSFQWAFYGGVAFALLSIVLMLVTFKKVIQK